MESSEAVSRREEGVLYTLPDKSPLHCRRCDSENRRLIKFKSPNNQPYYLCGACVEQEDKRELRFSPSWKRSRRPSTKLAVAAL